MVGAMEEGWGLRGHDKRWGGGLEGLEWVLCKT